MKSTAWHLLVLILLFSLFTGRAAATHIVGGELTLTYQARERYNLQLTLYFDALNGSPGALDQAVEIRIFSKRTNELVGQEVLNLISNTLVSYTNPDCALTPNGVQTNQLIYRKLVIMPGGLYSEAEGYYAVWDRCCRNDGIKNIISPGETGQLFYLEFPGQVQGGQDLINSSPALFRPLSDFACRTQPFTFNFSGSDPDGDSLAYSMVQPLAGNSSPINVGAYPGSVPPEPRPYPTVNWQPGYSNSVQITGSQPLAIDPRTGVLSMTPNQVGLFVFAIECREYRNRQLLGLVRREYQILVKDCEVNTPPHVGVETPTGVAIQPGDTITLDFGAGSACLPITIADTLPDRVRVSIIAPGLSRFGTFRDTVGATTQGQPSFSTTYCINSCAAFAGPVLEKVVIRVRDNACSIPAVDTIPFYVRVVPRPVPPIDFYPLDSNLIMGEQRVPVGTTIWLLQLRDSLPGSLVGPFPNATITPRLPAGASLTFSPARAGPPTLSNYEARLQMPCTADTNTVYKARIEVVSPFCTLPRRDSVVLYFRLKRQPLNPHILVTDSLGQPVAAGQVFRLQPGQELPLTLQGRSDFDSVAVSLNDQADAPLSVRFTPRQGPSPQSASWTWAPVCDDLSVSQEVRTSFLATIQDCGQVRSDTFSITLQLADTLGGDPMLGNVITPDANGQNDLLAWRRPTPVENCTGGFEKLEIYNRWGKRVFATTDIGFTWPPASVSSGNYFIVYRFAGKRYVRWVEVVK